MEPGDYSKHSVEEERSVESPVATYAEVVSGGESPIRNSWVHRFQTQGEEEALNLALQKSIEDKQANIEDDEDLLEVTPGFCSHSQKHGSRSESTLTLSREEEEYNPGKPVLPLGKYKYKETNINKEFKETKEVVDLTREQPSKILNKSFVEISSDEEEDVKQEAINRSRISRYVARRRQKEPSRTGGPSFQAESDQSSDDSSVDNQPERQRKIGPQQWDGVPSEKVEKLPEGIDGLCRYKVCNVNDVKERIATLKDGRSWKKDSRTEWSGYGRVRYANCKGSYQCANDQCIYKVEYGVVNSVQFSKKRGQLVCSLCHVQPRYAPCEARRYLVIKKSHVQVFHCGNHTCSVKPPQHSATKDNIKEYLRKNPDAKPSQVQSSYILSMVRNREDWDKVDKQAAELLNSKWIANRKQEVRKETEPYGHNFEAVAHFKQYCDVKDSFYIYKMNDNRGNPDRPSFVFKTSTLKAKIAINMNREEDHFLAQEFCFFDGKHKRAKGYVTLTASVYHPLLRRQIPLATMEAVSENTENVTLFWELFNEVIEKVSDGQVKQFNPIGWCTDMAGSNLSGLRDVFGEAVVHRIKTCEFHFKESVNRRYRKLSSSNARQFKDLSHQLLECVTPECYDDVKNQLRTFISQEQEEEHLEEWLEWWDLRRGFIFRAFAPPGPRMNQAESVHGGWAQKDPPQMTLLKVAEADVRESKLLDVEYDGIRLGTTAGGKGPTRPERQRTSHNRELEAARKLGEEMFDIDGRKIDEQSSHRPPPVKRKQKKVPEKPQKKKKTIRQLNDAKQDTPPAALSPLANPNPKPTRPKPQFGAFVIGLLQHQHPTVRVCYGCGGELKPGGHVPNPPNDLVIVSGDKRSYYDTQAKKVKQSDTVSNVYFHLNPNCVTAKHRYFIAGLIKVPDDLVPHLLEEHKEILKQITGVTVP